jgi:hypothetical protein
MTGQLRVALGDVPRWSGLIGRSLQPRYNAVFADLAKIPMEEFDAVVPLEITDYKPLTRRPELRGRKFLHPEPAVVSLCDDKLKLAEFLVSHGFGGFVPRFRTPGPPYPYVRKKRRGWWGMQCVIVQNEADERGLDLADEQWFTQELIPGQVEFATHILLAGGQIRYASTFVYRMAGQIFVKGAQDAPVHMHMMPRCPYVGVFADMLALLRYEGTACIDYKVVDRQPVLFEINPRFGGSLCYDITAYLDAYVGSLEATA